ncbi:enoyl-CoA hydratase-related protein [Calidifontibacillus erzurumensis]|uniref:Enoyl-CoA hydratase domain-containing protein 3, mitochondrial n=1 Tax=Calidifontibacillus erzurumensis TaxID=2741433 RepID=A0A8J8KF53_9BACI|nr:enoyl-CoA hydratase-related protein [Calidifontibacillus erzurumensis]NSL52525.1 enoyl-CoA hydratase/isomerase family protein [Calidifontibacillus erzurumensis]
MELLSLRQTEDIAYITLDNLKEFNTLTMQLIGELDQLLKDIAAKREVKVVVIEGSERVFSAGHSLKEIEAGTETEVLALFQACQNLMRTIREIPQLVISKVRSVAVAAGCQLVAASDLAVASTEARFATPGINSGLFCSTPAVFLSRNIGRKKAVELLFTGNFMSAEEALQHGLVNRVVPPEQLDEETEKLAKEITKQSLNIIELGKRQFYQQINMEDFQALSYSSHVIALNSKHPDAKEGIRAFLEKRKPVWNDKKQAEQQV